MKINFGTEIEGKKPGLSQDTLARIKYVKENLHYATVFEKYGFMWQSGTTHQLSCVFHAKNRDAQGRPYEEHPSARFYDESNRLWCFACSEGGDVVWFIRKKEGFRTLEEALDYIEQVFGVGINLQNLNARINAINSVKTEDNKKQIASKLYVDAVNDVIHKLKKVAPVIGREVDKLQPIIFHDKMAIDQRNLPYFDYVKALRVWRDAALQSINELVRKVQTPSLIV